MLSILANRAYARLFSAQVVALLGTGLLTVALGLMAYDLADDAAGVVLGTALTIKMVAYVGLSPLANALFARFNRKYVLIAADLVRAAIAVLLPFVDAIWQIYVLIFVLQTASASFTPAFQAAIPDILPDEEDYTRALSLSRLAYDLENIISPSLAGLLLTMVSYHWLFSGTAIGFFLSTVLIIMTQLPKVPPRVERSFRERLTRGIRIYFATPRLRGLLALNFVASAAGAMVIVNTVVIVRAILAGSESDVAIAFVAFGLGSMIAALMLPSLLKDHTDRPVMFLGAVGNVTLLLVLGGYVVSGGSFGWPILLGIWLLLGLSYATVLTPSGRLLKRSAHAEDRPALFAAQFALSHAGWLVTYPLSGWLGHSFGMGTAMLVLGCMAAVSLVIALLVWPRSYAGEELEHRHDDLPLDHPHLLEHGNDEANRRRSTSRSHRHVFVIDDEHRIWPTHG
ncbi:MAG: MFS transporter [Rhizobiaceae bacterium]